MMGTVLNENDLVFSELDGRPWLPDTVSHAWVKLAKRLGMGHISLWRQRSKSEPNACCCQGKTSDLLFSDFVSSIFLLGLR